MNIDIDRLALWRFFVLSVYKVYMVGLECSDRSETTVNRTYCFRSIDFDAQNISEGFLK